jgi:hypothetical protein
VALYEKYDKPSPTNGDAMRDAPGLELPDWSGMAPHRSRMTFEQAVRWNEEMLSLFPPRKKSPKLEAESRCHAEFML